MREREGRKAVRVNGRARQCASRDNTNTGTMETSIRNIYIHTPEKNRRAGKEGEEVALADAGERREEQGGKRY